jgi:DNA-binding MarR family transcriptional regulator
MSSPPKLDAAECLRIAETCGFYRLRRAARVVSRRIEEAFDGEELTPNQLFILLGLSLAGGAKLQGLADLMGVDHSTLSRTVTPLVARGWIREATGTDRRATPLELTDLGQRQAARAVASWRRFQSELESSLGAERWTRLSKDLDAVIALEGVEEVKGKGGRSGNRKSASRGARRG